MKTTKVIDMDKIFFCIDKTYHNLYIFKENDKSKYRTEIYLNNIAEIHIGKKIKDDIEKRISLKLLNDYELFFNDNLKDQLKNIIMSYFIKIDDNYRGFKPEIWRSYKIKKYETAMKIYKSILKTLYKQYKSILNNEEDLKEYINKLKAL